MDKPQYAILRFAKYKGPEICRIEAHDERTKEKYASNLDVDTSRSRMNFHLVKPCRSYRAEAEKQISEAGCRARKDSVRVVETLITASPEFFQGRKPREVREFFEYALEFIQSKQSPETIISAVVHVDEKTPHMHLCFVPLTPDKRLSAKDIIGNKKKLTQWQDDFWKHMVKKYPDFERGESASETGRTHIPPRLFKEAVRLNRQKDKIAQLLSEITPLNAKKKSAEIETILTDYIPSVEKLMTRMKKAGNTVKELKKEIAILEREVDVSKASVQRQLELAKKLQEFEALQQTVQDLEDEIAAIPPEIREKYKTKTERKDTIIRE
ncbi:MAG: MobV family relaxase [Candidatus Faecousia sp.]|nr:plasmid recombination protein [Clostridiales bacterium]MDY6179712.1 MobV family relaxase [Candidatus Faecousia sp.]